MDSARQDGGAAGQLRPEILPYEGIWPRIATSAFVAPGAVVVGDVEDRAGGDGLVPRHDPGRRRADPDRGEEQRAGWVGAAH